MSGACRDFALLMMEAVRSLGFAAHFVSGYLYDADLVGGTAPMVGGGATHAWADVYLPGAGWVEFDPTNGLIAGRNLIRVSVARTPDHAIPVAGGYLGRSADFVGYVRGRRGRGRRPSEVAAAGSRRGVRIRRAH